jgi:membrane protease YdiL (CAAX protease family)
MRETALFFLYLLGCLFLAALLTWPLMQTGWIDQPPQKVMGRLAQVLILAGLWPLLRTAGVANRASLGYGAPRGEFLRALGLGWLTGLAILTLLALALVGLGVRVPHPTDLDRLALKAIQALVGGLLVAMLEETFFRGAMYAAITRYSGALSAILWPALLYALLHFMRPRGLPDGVIYDWSGNWQVFLSTFTSPWQWRNLDSFVALLLVGVFLGLVRRRAGRIGWCIGLHAGWVFVIQVTRHLTGESGATPLAWLTGDYDGVIGWLAAGWIGVLALGLAWLPHRTAHSYRPTAQGAASEISATGYPARAKQRPVPR